MERVVVQDYQVLVLAAGESERHAANARGKVFEQFVARLMHEHGFDRPSLRNISVTSDGIELDVALKNTFTNELAFAEAKAYATNVSAQALTSFYGKLWMERIHEPHAHGYLFVLPKLTAEGDEKARAVEGSDSRFHYLDAHAIVESLVSRELVRPIHSALPARVIASDPALLIAVEGVYSCVKVLDPTSRRATRVIVWGKASGISVPNLVVDLLSQTDYALDLPVDDLAHLEESGYQQDSSRPVEEPSVIVTVRGSSSDFEYQFPASPRFFVGRSAIVEELRRIVDDDDGGVLILNAQSGWGKSSLALKLKAIVEDNNGTAVVIDSRTASSPAFVAEAIRYSAQKASDGGHITLPDDSSWASLLSATSTLSKSEWHRAAPLLIFFDQFENVFLDEATTRAFRDLALLVNDLNVPLLIGFAWKTDLVGWTESHPYRYRDEIRSVSAQVIVRQMGASDVEALLRRLEKRLGQRLARDLRQRLREYSQGLPWLFKKLSEHLIREVEDHGKSQEQLVNEALNVQSLFDSDLAGLQIAEQDALRYIARYAPILATEVTERHGSNVLQSLLDRRLVVPVGEKLDTYWDIFRDFLNTGQIPIEESYTIGMNPQAAGRVLAAAVEGGDPSFAAVASATGSTVGSVINAARTLRLLGIATYEAYGVHINEALNNADDRESAIRRVVSTTLKRHKARSLFVRLAEKRGGDVPLAAFAEELPLAFPAVDAKPSTWSIYARAFALWFQYSGLAVIRDNCLSIPPEGYVGVGSILSGEKLPAGRGGSKRREGVEGSPGRPLRLLKRLANEEVRPEALDRADRRALRNLRMLSLVQEDADGVLCPTQGVLVDNEIDRKVVRSALGRLPGGAECLSLLERNPAADTMSVGLIIRNALDADWQDSTVAKAGKDFRSWAREAGLELPWAQPNLAVTHRDGAM